MRSGQWELWTWWISLSSPLQHLLHQGHIHVLHTFLMLPLPLLMFSMSPFSSFFCLQEGQHPFVFPFLIPLFGRLVYFSQLLKCLLELCIRPASFTLDTCNIVHLCTHTILVACTNTHRSSIPLQIFCYWFSHGLACHWLACHWLACHWLACYWPACYHQHWQ